MGPPDVLFGAIVEHYVLGVNQTLVGPVARFLDLHWVWDEHQLLPHAWGIEDHLHFGDFPSDTRQTPTAVPFDRG